MPSIHTRAKKNQSCNGDVDQIRNNPKYSTWIIVEDCPSCLDIQYPEEQQEILCDVLVRKKRHCCKDGDADEFRRRRCAEIKNGGSVVQKASQLIAYISS